MGISVLVISSFPVYLDSLDRQSFRSELAKYMENHSEAELNINVTYPFLSLNNQDIEKSDSFVRDSLESAFQISNVDKTVFNLFISKIFIIRFICIIDLFMAI